MESAIMIGWIGFTSCLFGVVFGGIIARFVHSMTSKSVPIIFSLCAGMIFGLLFLDVIPHSVRVGGIMTNLIGSLGAFIFYQYLHKTSQRIVIITNYPQNDIYLHTSFMLAISIALHNFPVGLALGAHLHTELSTPLVKTLILHNIPEGVAIAVPLFMAGLRFLSVFILATIISIPVGLGAFIGSLTELSTSIFAGILTGFAVGIILLVTVHEILGKALKKGNIALSLLSLSVGIVLIYFYHRVI